MNSERTRTLTRRAFARRAAIILGTLVTAACDRGQSERETTPATPTPVATVKPTPVVVPSPLPGTGFDQTLTVDLAHPSADDANPGTEGRPLKTISKAADIAVQNNRRGMSTRVVVSPGVYREAILIQPKTPLTDAPMRFEAKQPRTVTIAGSDVWTGWTQQGTTKAYTHPWPYRWGLAPYPDGWQGNVTLRPIVRHREMIFLNGTALVQVLSAAELKEGTFFVSEQTATVSLVPPRGLTVEGATVEVAARPQTLVVEGARNLSVQGLTFVHGNSLVGDTAVIFSNCSDVAVEDCVFSWNNWSGMTFMSDPSHLASGVTARGNVANNNGAIGLEATRVKGLRYEDNETSYNNWRGALGELYLWANGGVKHLFIHDGVYRRHRAVGNQAPGFWFDTDCADIQVEDATCLRNYLGVFIEASEGPTSVTNSTLAQSTFDGLYTEGGDNVTLQGNIIYGNAGAQVHVLKGVRPVTNWETGEDLKLVAERWTLRKNIIVGTDAAPRLVQIGVSKGANKDLFLGTLTSDDNVWFSPKDAGAFSVDDKAKDFDAWRSLAKQDAHSQFVDPQFVDPANDNFDLRDTSPLRGGSPTG